MAWNSAWFDAVLATIVAVLFVIAGLINLTRRGAAKRDFERWGYPAWFQLLCGALELISAALLPWQHTRVLGLALAGAIIIGALYTLIRHREPFRHLAPALLFTALIVATAVAHG